MKCLLSYKKRKSKGFTLVELLGVITILSLVSVGAIYIVSDVINKSKEKGYQVSINNIEKSAGSYVVENTSGITWQDVPLNDLKQYSCIQIKHLIEMGYFDNNVLSSYVADGVTVQENDYIYIERDAKNKKIEKNILLYEGSNNFDAYSSSCAMISSSGIININVFPKGWQTEKEAIVKYKILRKNDSEYNYKYVYNYNYLDKDGNQVISGNNLEFIDNHTEKIEVKKNGIINASIEEIKLDKSTNLEISRSTLITSSLDIENIDFSKPSIIVGINNGDEYKKSNSASIKMVDEDSGFKAGKYRIYYDWSLTSLSCDEIKSKDKSVLVSVSNTNDKISTVSDVYISNKSGIGKLYVCSDDVVDYVDNKNEDVVFETMKLDNDKPMISLGNYNKDDRANSSVVLGLVVSDETSEVESFSKDKIVVTVGGSVVNNISLEKVNNNGDYNLIINNRTLNGELKILVKDSAILDEASNGNIETELTPEISFKNVYKIYYNANGGSGEMTFTECRYSEKCTIKESEFSYDYHTIKDIDWNKASDGSGTSYDGGFEFSSYENNNDITLYAQWRKNTISIKYNVNGGSIKTASNDNGIWTKDSNGMILRDGSEYTRVVNYGNNLGKYGLADYNNDEWVDIEKTGYIGVSGAEWKCLSGCTKSDETFSQTEVYDANDFCEAKNGDCTVELGVNWTPKTYTITYNLGNGTSTEGYTKLGTKTCKYDEDCEFPTFANLGGIFPYSSADNTANGKTDYNWSFRGWAKTKTGTTRTYSLNNGARIDLSDGVTIPAKSHYESITLYAYGRKDFRFNSGIAPTERLATVYQYWNPCSTSSSYLTSIELPNPTEISGWEFHGYRAGNNSASATVTFAANLAGTTITPEYNVYRTIRSVYKRQVSVEYNKNGGSGTTASTTGTQYYNSGYASDGANSGAKVNTVSLTLASNGFTYTGYNFTGWNTKKDGSGTAYAAGATYSFSNGVSDLASKDLYAKWNAKTYTINYDLVGGTAGSNKPTSAIFDSVVQISNPTKSVTIVGNVNGTGATIGSSTSANQTFAGWTSSSSDGLNTSTAKYGSTSSSLGIWNGSLTKNKYFKNLRTDSGDVKLKANWTPVSITLPTVSKTGYSCKWNTNADGSGGNYDSGASYTPSATSSSSVTMYAICSPYKVNINYNVNGGKIKKASNDNGIWTSDNNGKILRDGSTLTTTLKYGQSLSDLGTSGLMNYNKDTWLNIGKTGYIGLSGAEWKCLSGCTKSGDTFSQTSTSYKHSDFCEAKNGDCTVELGVNWVDNIVPICSINAEEGSAILSAAYEDNVGVVGYYFGKTVPSESTSFTSIPSKISGTITGTVNSEATYYFGFKDGVGNIGYCSGNVKKTTKKCLYDGSIGSCYYSVEGDPVVTCVCTRQSDDYPISTPANGTSCISKCNSLGYIYSSQHSVYSCDGKGYGPYNERWCMVYSEQYKYTCDSGYTKLNNNYCFKVS